MIGKVKTHEDYLRSLLLLKPKFRKALLIASDDEEINCVCECIYNVLKGNIPVEKKEKQKLKKFKNILRKLVLKGKNKSRKRIIIQKGGGFLPIILGSVLTALIQSFTG